MIPRLLPDSQLELFPGMVMYVSQADAATALGISTRMIQYWESQGLLHPEHPQEGRSRRYTSRDLVEMAFIKGMLVDQGYTVPALKEKLDQLQAPYYYSPEDLFWDLRDRRWKSRGMLAAERLAELQERLLPALAALVEEEAGRTVLGLVREGLAGRLPPARRKRKGPRQPRGQEAAASSADTE